MIQQLSAIHEEDTHEGGYQLRWRLGHTHATGIALIFQWKESCFLVGEGKVVFVNTELYYVSVLNRGSLQLGILIDTMGHWDKLFFSGGSLQVQGFINPNSYKKLTDVVETSGFFFDFPESDYTTNHHHKTAAKNQRILPTCLSLNEVFFFGSKNFQGGFKAWGSGGNGPLRFWFSTCHGGDVLRQKNPAFFWTVGELLLVFKYLLFSSLLGEMI